VEATKENVAKAVEFMERAHLIGALDMGNALGVAEGLRNRKRGERERLVHVGTGNAVLGTRDQKELIQKIGADWEYVGIGVGKTWNRGFMREAAARTGGYFTQINPDEDVKWRAMDTMAALNASRLMAAAATAGDTLMLAGTDAVSAGEELWAIVRLDKGEAMPESVIVHGQLDGKVFSQKLAVKNVGEGAGYLPRTWARLEIDRLLAGDVRANREKIVALSKSTYVMSPFTSLLVLENEAMYTQYKVDRGRKDHWAMYDCPETIAVVTEPLPNSTRGGVTSPVQPVVVGGSEVRPGVRPTRTGDVRGRGRGGLDALGYTEASPAAPPAPSTVGSPPGVGEPRGRTGFSYRIPPEPTSPNDVPGRRYKQPPAPIDARDIRGSGGEDEKILRFKVDDAWRADYDVPARGTGPAGGRSPNQPGASPWYMGSLPSPDRETDPSRRRKMEVYGAGGGGAGGNDDFGMGSGRNEDDARYENGDDYRSEIAVRQLRLKVVSMNFQRRSLGEVIDYLSEQTELPIHVKWPVLESVGISRRTPVTLNLQKFGADDALQALLEQFSVGGRRLVYAFDDGVIVISTAENLRSGAALPTGATLAQRAAKSLMNQAVDAAGPAEQGMPAMAAALHYVCAERWDLADRQLGELLGDARCGENAALWRAGAMVAGMRGLTAVGVTRLDRALDIEYRREGGSADVAEIRGDYGRLLAGYQELAKAVAGMKDASASLVGGVVRAADRWRTMDPEVTPACQAAARALTTLGETELAWEYLTTPLADATKGARPWLDLAAALANQGQADLAGRACAAAAQIEPGDPRILWEYAELLWQIGRGDEARALYSRIAGREWGPQYEQVRAAARQRLAR
ncbi:MAG: tetratricopeptide repeat protein, partial [Planctomycetota bacterium]|nr:tetratricopeptide repeat protein [Planctomycetota bacterium]